MLFESLRDENRPHPGNMTERKEAAYMVGPDWGHTWPSLALSWVEQEHDLDITCSQLASTWAQLDPN